MCFTAFRADSEQANPAPKAILIGDLTSRGGSFDQIWGEEREGEGKGGGWSKVSAVSEPLNGLGSTVDRLGIGLMPKCLFSSWPSLPCGAAHVRSLHYNLQQRMGARATLPIGSLPDTAYTARPSAPRLRVDALHAQG